MKRKFVKQILTLEASLLTESIAKRNEEEASNLLFRICFLRFIVLYMYGGDCEYLDSVEISHNMFKGRYV